MIPTKDAILITLSLDLLDERGACYVGANGATAAIDRAMFNSQGMPTQVTMVVDVPTDRRTPSTFGVTWDDPVADTVTELPDWVHDGDYDAGAIVAFVRTNIADMTPSQERVLRIMIKNLPKGTE